MRMGLRGLATCLIAWVASALLCDGCATMGLYAAGKAIADHNLQEGPPPHCDNARIRIGERIELILKDGRHVRGYFRGLDCASDSTLILSFYSGTSSDIEFGNPESQRIPISEIQNTRVPNHSFERRALVIGILMDAVLISFLAALVSGFQGIGD